MKYVSQATIIFGFTLLGELLHALLPLPIPSAIYGLVLLFGALNTGLIKLEQVKDAGGFLISILPILIIYLACQKYFVNSQVSAGFGGT